MATPSTPSKSSSSAVAATAAAVPVAVSRLDRLFGVLFGSSNDGIRRRAALQIAALASLTNDNGDDNITNITLNETIIQRVSLVTFPPPCHSLYVITTNCERYFNNK
jgi:hypothetical protein